MKFGKFGNLKTSILSANLFCACIFNLFFNKSVYIMN